MFSSQNLHIVLSFLLFGEFLTFSGCDDIGSNIMGKVRYSRRSNAPIIRRLVGKSLRECVVECGIRSSCVGLNYHRATRMCELLGASSMPFEAGPTKGWMYIPVDDTLNEIVMEQHCGNRENCPPGQTCYKKDSNFLCGIKECPEPVGISDAYKPNSGFMLHVNAKIRMSSDKHDKAYYIRCCADGNWAEHCPATQTSTLPSSTTPVTSTTPKMTSSLTSTSQSTSTTTEISITWPTIDEDEWYTLESETRKRQLALVSDVEITWNDAMVYCESNGGYLAHVNTLDEQEKIHNWLSAVVPGGGIGVSSVSSSDDEFWVGGVYYKQDNEWFWKTPSGKGDIINAAWGSDRPTTDVGKSCVNLYKDSRNTNLYSLRNSHCRVERNFICERDLVDVTLNDNDWFTFNSTIETREMAMLLNPTLSWDKAQEVCSRNGATLAHVYSSEERLSLPILSTELDDKLWVGAKFNRNFDKWYWWSDNLNMDNYVETDLWANVESMTTDYCLYLSQVSVAGLYALEDSNCTKNNGFLCQRRIYVNIDIWFPLRNGDTVVREIAVVNTPALTWHQSKAVCEEKGGILLQITSEVELKLLYNALQENGINTNEDMWIGGRAESNSREWYWWWNDFKSVVDWSGLALTGFDLDTGACMVLASPKVQMINKDCNTLRPFLCQRGLTVQIEDTDWFQVNDRMMVYVSKNTSLEVAKAVCEWNDGILASIHDKSEIITIQTEFNARGILYPQQLWVGGTFNESIAKWVWQADNIEIEHNLWFSGIVVFPDQYPDNACVQLYNENIHNEFCRNNYSFLCQKANPNTRSS